VTPAADSGQILPPRSLCNENGDLPEAITIGDNDDDGGGDSLKSMHQLGVRINDLDIHR
jgi:hypothetical protein